VIEQGLVILIQESIPEDMAPGGFAVQLPPNQITEASPMAWTYTLLGGTPVNALHTVGGLRMRRLQIDCFGLTAAHAFTLASAVQSALDGFSGALKDPDKTVVDNCLLSEEPYDFPFDAAARNYRRMIEFELWFFQ